MRWKIDTQVPFNSFDYFEKTLIAPNGFREYDLRWLLGREINPNGFYVMGRSYGTYLRGSWAPPRLCWDMIFARTARI
jgi:phosphomannomutase/phosphoglucomutase